MNADTKQYDFVMGNIESEDDYEGLALITFLLYDRLKISLTI